MTTLDEIAARASVATEGPWEVERGIGKDIVTAPHQTNMIRPVCEVHSPAMNAEFIAAARTDVPRLVDALRAVENLHQPSQRQHVSHTANGTIIGYKNVDDGPCVACYPEPRELHCEDCEDVDEICEGVRGSIGTWPCPTIRAIREALG